MMDGVRDFDYRPTLFRTKEGGFGTAGWCGTQEEESRQSSRQNFFTHKLVLF